MNYYPVRYIIYIKKMANTLSIRYNHLYKKKMNHSSIIYMQEFT